ncbi:MAG: DUF6345 domain-containing protein [Anaerolineae bacterium]
MLKKSVRMIVLSTFLAGLLFGISFDVGYAEEQPPRNPEGTSAVLDDGGTAEVGVEWITDWPGTADDRANWYYSANNLYNELRNAGWIGRFNWGNTNAWERDFKAASYGGNGLIDTVDLGMIGTHGSSAWDPRYNKVLSSVYFSSNNDDWHLSPGEAYRSLGDNDLEWLAFDSCSVLRNDSMWYWHQAFDGLHLMMGFANTMYVVYPGDGGVWGDQMQKKGWWIFGHGAKTVTQAWFTAVEDQQPSGVRARVLAEELNNYNDYIWGQGYVSPDYPNNNGYWYWDHVAGTPAPLQLAAVPTSLPILNVVPRTVNPDFVMQVGQAFSLTGEVLPSPDGSAFYMVGGISDTLQLRVDAFSGGFLFQNLGELWTNPEMPRTLSPSGREAAALVSNFMASHGEGLPGAIGFFTTQIAPTTEMEGPSVGFPEAGIASVTAMTPTNWAVHYARSVYDPYSMQEISIVGPGARWNFYIGDNDQVIGAKGGWRDYEPITGPAAGLQATAAVTVPIKTAEVAWAEFLADPTIALAQPPQALTYTQKLTPTLAYYEQSLSISQTQLIPAWVFVADLYTETMGVPVALQATTAMTALVASDVNIYVPAAADELALPQVAITSPAPGTVINPGQSVSLSGGATGGQEPYTYLWTSSVDGELGPDPIMESPALHPDLKSGLQANELTLLVVDANGMHATANVDVLVRAAVYLPLVLKQ